MTDREARIELRDAGVDFIVHRGGIRAADAAEKEKAGLPTGGVFHKVNGKWHIAALADINLTFSTGDRIGIVGHNGSGKTTILRLLAGILEPTKGSVMLKGRVSSMMSTTHGFDMRLTGRENIIRRGMMMGMTSSEIRAKQDEIIEFTELGEFIEAPMQMYSAGMRARLGFAITTAIDTDIIIMDEWIGAGDRRFAERARGRLLDTIGRSQILVLASHKDELLKQICNKIVVLEKGRIMATGGPSLITEYGDYVDKKLKGDKRQKKLAN